MTPKETKSCTGFKFAQDSVRIDYRVINPVCKGYHAVWRVLIYGFAFGNAYELSIRDDIILIVRTVIIGNLF